MSEDCACGGNCACGQEEMPAVAHIQINDLATRLYDYLLEEMFEMRERLNEYQEIAEGLHVMQESNGWCDCHKGGDGICDLAKKLQQLRKQDS
jgi:hypothetical protein